MAGNRIGGLKAAHKNKKLYGQDFYQRAGAKGGSHKNPNKGFGSSHERAVRAGRKGGTKSVRGPSKLAKTGLYYEDIRERETYDWGGVLKKVFKK